MENHLGGCIIEGDIGTFAPQVWDKLIEIYKPKTFLDIGCGAGHSLKYFLDKGIDGIGVEGWIEAIKRSKVSGNIIEHDYTLKEYEPQSTFDLSWCCEFVEHVEEKYINNFMKTFSKCKVAAITHGVPEQPGYHHVNCQIAQYWIDIFKQYNFHYKEELSLSLRRLLKDENGNPLPNGNHVMNTLMVFEQEKQ
jgi:SAM-dependent methyltransferase